MRRRNPDAPTVLKYLLIGVAAYFTTKKLFPKVAEVAQTAERRVETLIGYDIPYIGLNDNTIVQIPHAERFANEPMADREYAITRLGGVVVDPTLYPLTVAGFQAYLKDSSVNTEWASARELTTPNHPNIAAKYGYTVFLPPHVWWPKGAALALMQNRMREHLGKPIVIYNWWRPTEYNTDPVVGGAPRGDHPDADAVDLGFKSHADKNKALEIPQSLYSSEPELALTIGTYSSPSLHIGIQSDKGRRKYYNA
jgi:hypothetical protein